MLHPLREMVEAWAPKRTRSNDPMAAVMSVWEDIVGTELSQKTRPMRLDGATLHITTSSGAWSQQLAFLEPQIISALRSLPEITNVERLRFRVGRMQLPEAPTQSPGSPTAPHVRAQVYAIPIGIDPLERLRLRCTRRRRDARALCELCEVPMQRNRTRCAPCAYAEHVKRNERVQQIIYKTPWSTHEGVSAQVGGLALEEYDVIRRALLRRWREILDRVERTGKLRADGFERRIAESYIPLQAGLASNQISSAGAQNLLGARLKALLSVQDHE
jgi:Dna[CI] antecedent, DciA